MNRLFAAVVLLGAMTLSARAHFIFIVPASDSRTVQVVFSDSTKPDKADLLKKIAHTKFVVRDAKGKETAVKAKVEKTALSLTVPGKGPTWVAGTCQYGVIRGKTPFLLNYSAKSLVEFDLQNPPGKEIMQQSSKTGLDIIPILGGGEPKAKVVWNGKPVAGAEVVLLVPGKDKAVELTSDKDGLVTLEEHKGNGVYAIRARHVEKKKGKLGDKSYDEVRHYATLTAYVKGE